MQMHNCHRSTSPFYSRRWTSTSTSEFDTAPSKQRMNDALKNLSGQISFPPYKLNYSVHLFQCGRSLRPPLLLLFQNKPSIILPQQLLPINVRWITRLAKHGSRTIHPHLILSTRLFLKDLHHLLLQGFLSQELFLLYPEGRHPLLRLPLPLLLLPAPPPPDLHQAQAVTLLMLDRAMLNRNKMRMATGSIHLNNNSSTQCSVKNITPVLKTCGPSCRFIMR